jgi:hypothetical protein
MVRGIRTASSVTTTKSYPNDRMKKLKELAKIIKGM